MCYRARHLVYLDGRVAKVTNLRTGSSSFLFYKSSLYITKELNFLLKVRAKF